ncbi:MAG TPA: metallopeptidase TldD-related protein [Candidatus Saccharimonadales bacterium]|nr:metallopeptidase TldD-related protein [Candidatus Saccharimonadales bacterium]
MKTILKRLTLLSALLLSITVAFAADAKSAQDGDDPVLRDLRTEMARSKAQLRLENMSTPYFIDYRVMDIDDWEADAALGGVRGETRSRIRFLLVQVRLGDYKQDNSSTRGEGAMEVVPIDSDEHAFRFQVWNATDKAYKQAVEALTDKQARLKQLTIDHPVDDFARAEAVQSLQPVVTLKVEREPWLKMLRDASGLYTQNPKVQFLAAALSFKVVNRYYVNSEGTVVRSGEELYHIGVSGTAQAEDGMRLDRSTAFTATSLRDLPKVEELKDSTTKMLATLEQLREAPLADEDYHGPVLISADSASTIFSSLIGDSLLGIKPELGQNARVRGQFASSYKTRVLPEFLTLVDDPTLTTIQGTALLGHYEVDDEGVKAQTVPLVEKGMLVNYLLGRQPIRDFAFSNGHGRANLPVSWPAPALGNLVVRSSDGVAPEELKKKLIAICNERGLEYGYYVGTMMGPRIPRLLYRVWAKDGHEELVRGGLFGDLDQRSMRSNIIAAGSDQYVDNELMPVPHSVVAPSILFDDLEVKRQTSNKDKLPEYPAPETAKR